MRLASVLICLLAWTGWALAQTPDRIYRVSVLAEGRAVQLTRSIIIPELAKLGFEHGRNLIVEMRFTTPDKMDALANEVVSLKPDAMRTALAKCASEAAGLFGCGGTKVYRGMALFELARASWRGRGCSRWSCTDGFATLAMWKG